jgi:LPXTG-motif cell wall-anchored protein
MYRPSTENPDKPVPPVVTNRPPTADGTAGEPYMVLIDQVMRFNGSRSYDSDGTIVLYHWSFGDGTTADGVIVTHQYTTIGTYTVVLTVTDNDGATDTYETTARYRLPNRSPLPPTITGPGEYHQNVNYVFNIVTTDPDADDVRYMIAWGDGIQNTTYLYTSGQNFQRSHHWTTYGFYTISVSAQDALDATSNITKMMITVDVEYIGSLGYLINTDGSGPYDTFYSNQTKDQEKAQRQQTGIYLIDANGDGNYDYQYNPTSKTYRQYPETLSPNYTMLLIGLGVVILLLLLIGYLVRRRKNKPNQ